MDSAAYQTARWRALPRTQCVVEHLLGDAAGPCGGLIHRHHIDPSEADSRTVSVCAAHHPRIHSILRKLAPAGAQRRCTHRHPYPGGREACERKLNRAA